MPETVVKSCFQNGALASALAVAASQRCRAAVIAARASSL